MQPLEKNNEPRVGFDVFEQTHRCEFDVFIMGVVVTQLTDGPLFRL